MKSQRSWACIIGACFAIPVTVGAAEITLFEGPNFQGRSVTFHGEANNLDPIGFNDRASSIIVRDGVWEGCSDAYFQGSCAQFRPGEYPQLNSQANHRISSLRLVGQPAYQSGNYSNYYAPGTYPNNYYGPNRGNGNDSGYYGFPYQDRGN